MTFTKGDRQDPDALAAAARTVGLSSAAGLARRVQELVADNAAWRGRRCLNLIAAESPTSPAVRALLSAEVGTRASGGHIGPLTRCFPGLGVVDEIEALCIELLKQAFGAAHADHRLLGGMAGCMVAVAALTEPGDVLMSLPVPKGGDSSGRLDGPPGVRGLTVVDIPCSDDGLTVDLDAFRAVAERHRPRLVSLNQAMTLFPLPVRQLKEIVAPWGGRLYFDGAHQAGLIAGGVYPSPLADGADLLTGSGGKTFSGPQSGIVVWDDDRLSRPVTTTIFPTLTGSHQINRVAALAVATAEQLAYGRAYMRQTVANAVALAAALADAGFEVFAREHGYTSTHQILLDVRDLGPGIAVAQALERADIMVNKMLLPSDPDRPDAEPSGIRLGTVEVTRLGMREHDMVAVAGLIRRVLLDRVEADVVAKEVARFRESFQRLYYCFETGLPPSQCGSP
ncbi:MAG: serine hydroxymethyltransferase [Mycobacteriales bacterium]